MCHHRVLSQGPSRPALAAATRQTTALAAPPRPSTRRRVPSLEPGDGGGLGHRQAHAIRRPALVRQRPVHLLHPRYACIRRRLVRAHAALTTTPGSRRPGFLLEATQLGGEWLMECV
jgi:hypothetical protein